MLDINVSTNININHKRKFNIFGDRGICLVNSYLKKCSLNIPDLIFTH